MWWLELPKQIRQGTCVGVVGMLYPRWGSSPLGSDGRLLLGLLGGGLRWRFAGVSGIHLWERANLRVGYTTDYPEWHLS